MKDFKVVAFDCDGVLFDTEQANWAYYDHILRHFGKPAMTPEQFAYAHQHTLNESIAYLFNDEESIAAAYDYRETMDYGAFLKLLKVEPYLVQLLTKIRPKLKTAIATNRSDTMNRLLTEFELSDYFDLVVTSFDIRHPKPHPDSLFKILDYFDIESHQALYIGDSQVDAEAAGAAKIPFVAFRNETLPTEYHIENLKQLEEILEV
ncbi:MAG: HAD family hydrolase [Desulfobacterales bacterium]|jgi:HAD superfamily hydrolase (TIGR01509 family)|nr:HAD family hydrolase [Desulfobacterales bacterium]